MPRIGAWTADLKLRDAPPTGACTITVNGSVSFVGTALPRPASTVERHAVKIVGGGGGLDVETSEGRRRSIGSRARWSASPGTR